MKRFVIILISLLSSVLLYGCATSIDTQAFTTLANRITQLEKLVNDYEASKTNVVVAIKTVEPFKPVEYIETKTIWINNDNGSSSPIKLIFKDNQYFGPKGERYNSLPSQRQLEKVYSF